MWVSVSECRARLLRLGTGHWWGPWRGGTLRVDRIALGHRTPTVCKSSKDDALVVVSLAGVPWILPNMRAGTYANRVQHRALPVD